MQMRFRANLVLALLAALPCLASETVTLLNGFQILTTSHTVDGEIITLVTSSGTIQLPNSQVSAIEAFIDTPSPKHQEIPPAQPKSTLELLSQAAWLQGDAPEFNRLVRSVAMAESGLNPAAVSRKGAIGLMQLMPSTAKDLGVQPRDPGQNATGGAHLLAQLLKRYHYDSVRALAAYNAGVGAVEKYRGVPPFAETQAYVRRVLKIYAQLTVAEKSLSAHATP